MPLPDVVRALQRSLIPQNVRWFDYKWSEPAAQLTVARALAERLGMVFYPEDILLTNGAYAAISVTLAAILKPGDEVIFLTPPWFFYEALILANGGAPVRVVADRHDFEIDLTAVEAAVSPRTRAIVINSPNNPTGRMYRPETLSKLARLLGIAGERSGRRVSIISDEAYSRIVFDGRRFHSPAQFYADTFVIYTYSKTLLTLGSASATWHCPQPCPTGSACDPISSPRR